MSLDSQASYEHPEPVEPTEERVSSWAELQERLAGARNVSIINANPREAHLLKAGLQGLDRNTSVSGTVEHASQLVGQGLLPDAVIIGELPVDSPNPRRALQEAGYRNRFILIDGPIRPV